MISFDEKNNFFSGYEKIYLDTSAAMHATSFEIFVCKNEKLLKEINRQIYVLKVVWLELIRNYNSLDSLKSSAAEKAISIISSHRCIFDIEDEEVLQYEMEKAFADKELLARIIMERTDSNILLITNDSMLSIDANNMNHQLSCKGHKIITCYVSKKGLLRPGYGSDIEEDNEEKKVIIEEATKDSKESEERNDNSLFNILLCSGLLSVGFFLGKYYKDILNVFVKSKVC